MAEQQGPGISLDLFLLILLFVHTHDASYIRVGKYQVFSRQSKKEKVQSGFFPH